jgi:urease accessory protein
MILGILGSYDVVGSMYILTMAKYVAELNEAINSSLQKFFKISGGATILPHNSGVLVRMLGSVASDLRNAMYELIRIIRRIILNASFSGIRKG